MKKKIILLIFTLVALQACKPSETFLQQKVHPDDIHTVSTNLNLYVPAKCKNAGEYIYQDLRLEKFRHRYINDTLQALVNLSICLDENGNKKEAAEIGFEVLLLSEVSNHMPENLEFVNEIVSDSDWHTYAERSWAHWTFTSKTIDSLDDLRTAPESASRMQNVMLQNKRIALGGYFDQFQSLKN